MTQTEQERQTFKKFDPDFYIPTWIEAFLIDRKAAGLVLGSVKYYREKLQGFWQYCESQSLTRIDQLSPVFLRQFLLYLEETGHNPGGIHGYYRSIKAFLRWYEQEVEPDNWKNPIKKVRAPKVPEKIIEPVELVVVKAMIAVCGNDFMGTRDKALMYFLLDTGLRAHECLNCDWNDVTWPGGAVVIKQGKGRKPRTVFLQKTARRALRAWRKIRKDEHSAIWLNKNGERLEHSGLRDMLVRRAKTAKVKPPTPHDFRRAFALNCLRNGMDLITLARLMGHTSLAVLKRYLKQVDEDLHEVHAKASPVERMKGN